MTASGTSGNDVELSGYMPMGRLGAVVVKVCFMNHGKVIRRPVCMLPLAA